MKTGRTFHALWQWARNVGVPRCLAPVSNPLGRKAAGDGMGIQTNTTQKHKCLCFIGFMWVTQMLAWNAEISPLIKIVSMKELAFRIPAYWLAFLFFLFLKCCRHSWHLCHLKITAALPAFTWRHPHHWELFWEMATCPLIQKCDFWMECRQMISAEWVSSRGRPCIFLFSLCDSKSLSLFIQLPCVRAYRLCMLLSS